ncbi:N,N-dimethylformamidase beta subunit family domain-containing protein [Roseomonas sp. CECT 9278]|uniref:N,N-dimethylformamidase beta subunit family domain-containing protein n=1 Tax=Roseomonas sp. CECT 9278 TaxID=2845823 RepID=UPI001E640518|nr:N,N-dimethylformamidase beta subunit family domain-containing protein [Roseomonas sp. CECT 9278]CAH0199643.1 N,N-dimethylformamidase beta subunit [Roseomonas sp. CECT 9278]
MSPPIAELPITAYLDRFSRRPGERFAVKASMRDGGTARARLVRVICGDPNPHGPGLRFEDLSHRFDITFEAKHQPIHAGSCAVVPRAPRRDSGPCTWSALVWLAAQPPDGATVLAETQDGATVTLSCGPDGLAASFTGEAGSIVVATGRLPALRQWHRVWTSGDPATGCVVVGLQPLDGTATVVRGMIAGLRLPDGSGRITIAANGARPAGGHLTGKTEAPALHARFSESWTDDDADLVARWDFARDIPTQRILDIGPQGCDGHLVNVPTRAVVGARWSGREMCWRHAPEDYAAIHFHADDLGDCGWHTTFFFEVPADLRSGAYALHLKCEGGEDRVPLYVLPPRGTASAPVAFLASTFTYQAYANHARGNADAAYRARVAAWGAYPHNADDYPIYGRSTYNKHPDGSGIGFSSRLRPILTMRPGYLTFNDARGSGLRHYPADTHILAWLEAKGIAFDVITDEDLHEEGVALLDNYRVVMTGSHPEYHTLQTLDALAAYTRGRGRLMYLGGNGFYWRIAVTQTLPGVMELRRSEGGIRAWAAEPGEYWHQTDGAYGGLWRRNRRPPQMLAGVGFSGQGLFEGTHYRLLPAARDPRHAWIFGGVTGEIFGGYGLSGGGAAGFELDRADPALGTPGGTAILARSEDPPASFVTVPEELLSHITTISGEKADALKRAEVVYFDTPGGGAVFTTGSITWCGSLWQDGAFQGDVSRIMENVLRRFAAP